MKKMIYRIIPIAIIVCMLASLLVSQTFAATQKNIFFKPFDEKDNTNTLVSTYFVKDSSAMATTDGQQTKFCDGNNEIILKIPLAQDATVANLVVTVSANYACSVGASQALVKTDIQNYPDGAGVGGVSDSNKGEIKFDVSQYCPQGFVYFRIGDQTTANGWGGKLWQVLLTYSDYPIKEIFPFTTAGIDYEFIPGTDKEKSVIATGYAGGQIGGKQRFTDGGEFCLYRLPYSDSKQAWLNFEVAANYDIKILKPDFDDPDQAKPDLSRKYRVVANPVANGKTADGVGTTKRLYKYDFRKLVREKFGAADASRCNYVYFKLGDQSVTNGNGGQLHYLGIHYGTTNNMPDAFKNKVKKYDGVVYTKPQRVTLKKKVVSYVPVYSNVTIKKDRITTNRKTTYDTSEIHIPVSDVDGDIIPIEDPISVPETISAVESPTEQPAVIVSLDEGFIWYAIFGAIALLLLAAALVQYIYMEKKRKSGK